MSCGFPDASLSLPGVTALLPRVPALPAVPDASLALSLGFGLPDLGASLSLPIPSAPVPKVPALPTLPDVTLAIALGLPVASLQAGLSLPLPVPPGLPKVPTPPAVQAPFCPFDEAA